VLHVLYSSYLPVVPSSTSQQLRLSRQYFVRRRGIAFNLFADYLVLVFSLIRQIINCLIGLSAACETQANIR
jgi:hypothetical protein